MAGFYHANDPTQPRQTQNVSLSTHAFFHISGMVITMRAFVIGEALVLLVCDEEMLKAVEKYKATYTPLPPSYIAALVKSEFTEKYDISPLKWLACGGAPLGTEVSKKFREKFSNVKIAKEYGLTETAGMVAGMRGPKDESKKFGFAGRLAELMEAKIVDPVTEEALPTAQERGAVVARPNTDERSFTLITGFHIFATTQISSLIT